MARPRILYLLGSLAANDLGEEFVSVLRRVAQQSFDPVVGVLGGKEELRHRIEELGVRVHPLKLVGPLGTLRSEGRVRDLVRTLDPALVHGFGSWAGAVAEVATPDNVPVVRNVSRAPTYERDFKGRLLRRLERKARARSTTWFVVPHKESIGLAERAYGGSEERVAVLPMSVDVARVRGQIERTPRAAARETLGLGVDAPVAALLTSFESQARMDELLTGVRAAADLNPALRVLLIGAGRYDGPTRWKADELGLEDSVLFLGPGSETAPAWAAADLAVDLTPSPGWSRTALLALAAGLPTVKVQSGMGGWSEDLSEHLPMMSGEPDRFAKELVDLCGDAEARANVVAANGNVVADVDVESVARRLGELYTSALA